MAPGTNEDAQEKDRADVTPPPEGEDRPDRTDRPKGSPESPRARMLRLGACAVAIAVAMTAGAVVLGNKDDDGVRTVASAPGVAPELLATGSLASSISALQTHLKAQPKDYGGWSTLGRRLHRAGAHERRPVPLSAGGARAGAVAEARAGQRPGARGPFGAGRGPARLPRRAAVRRQGAGRERVQRAGAVHPHRRPGRTRPLQGGVQGRRPGRRPPPRHPGLHPLRLRTGAARRRHHDAARPEAGALQCLHPRRHRLRGDGARPTRLARGRVQARH